jgi:hypothetical protein
MCTAKLMGIGQECETRQLMTTITAVKGFIVEIVELTLKEA